MFKERLWEDADIITNGCIVIEWLMMVPLGCKEMNVSLRNNHFRNGFDLIPAMILASLMFVFFVRSNSWPDKPEVQA